MAKKEAKTNAMRMLEKNKISFESHTYECTEFTDGAQIADTLGLPHEKVYKTLVTVGKSRQNYVFVLPIDAELDMKKAAKAAGEKSLEMLPLKELTPTTGYVRGGCTSIGMKKQFPTIINSSILELEKVVVSGGRLGLQIELVPADLIRWRMWWFLDCRSFSGRRLIFAAVFWGNDYYAGGSADFRRNLWRKLEKYIKIHLYSFGNSFIMGKEICPHVTGKEHKKNEFY